MFKILLLAVFCGFLTPSKGYDIVSSFCPCQMEDDFRKAFDGQLLNLIPGGILPNIGGLLGSLSQIAVVSIDIGDLSLKCKENYGITLHLNVDIILKALGVANINAIADVTVDLRLIQSVHNITLKLLDDVNPVIEVKVKGLNLLGTLMNTLVDLLLKTLKVTVIEVLQVVLSILNLSLGTLTAVLRLGDAGSMQCLVQNVTVTATEVVLSLTTIVKNEKEETVPVLESPGLSLPPPLPQNNVSLAVSDAVMNTALSLPKYKTSKVPFDISTTDFVHILPEFREIVTGSLGFDAWVSLSTAPVLQSVESGATLKIGVQISVSIRGSDSVFLELDGDVSLDADVSIKDKHLCVGLSVLSDANLGLRYKRSSVACGCQNVAGLKQHLYKVLSTFLSVQLNVGLCIVPMPQLPVNPELLQGAKCIPHKGYFSAQK
ncbi:uncharacterized protein LOC115476755 [Microcaecilia unicolor]|uniref:Uncharacterized protein LOC115476755 n=1 Tax=Microcaecilia unicolor TaxID=1415580 RepID=A0A6P7Z0B9_9AMPH|nr:uncharacterized protein LOC115476755 [Microcaecilia unicolor]XP_030069190.1 uncharacterized protein LOC115476755 [Microcaecilia unicolor]